MSDHLRIRTFLVTQFIPKNLGVLTGAMNNVPAFLKIDYTFAGIMKRALQGGEAAASKDASMFYGNSGGNGILTPSTRRRTLARIGDVESYKNVVALVGEDAPDKALGLAYVALEKALRQFIQNINRDVALVKNI
ncbi:hypothetical protein BGZ65_003673 [Modicella reniformis]|uniref:Uncharacterized protein n=1 Tax=Modicella reniformis TaxID=1440133 RepID=A0A9P6M2S6_9FUNG|nr:hypothetical protein BGZ65_003673 [Modicella reniformis]